MSYYQEKKDGLTLHVRVQPKASRNQLDGVVGEHLRIRLTAPPVEGAANDACVRFVAELFETSRSKVTLVAGHKAREKTLHVAGEAGVLRARLEALVSAG